MVEKIVKRLAGFCIAFFILVAIGIGAHSLLYSDGKPTITPPLQYKQDKDDSQELLALKLQQFTRIETRLQELIRELEHNNQELNRLERESKAAADHITTKELLGFAEQFLQIVEDIDRIREEMDRSLNEAKDVLEEIELLVSPEPDDALPHSSNWIS